MIINKWNPGSEYQWTNLDGYAYESQVALIIPLCRGDFLSLLPLGGREQERQAWGCRAMRLGAQPARASQQQPEKPLAHFVLCGWQPLSADETRHLILLAYWEHFSQDVSTHKTNSHHAMPKQMFPTETSWRTCCEHHFLKLYHCSFPLSL